jgi:ATP-dependent Clp protease ATP-binding subunit ClpB
MDPNRMTEKAQDAVRQAQTLAQRHGQSQIEPEHLAVALLSQDGGMAARVIEKAGAAVPRCSSGCSRRSDAAARLRPRRPGRPGLRLRRESTRC